MLKNLTENDPKTYAIIGGRWRCIGNSVAALRRHK
jgi:hypothetical protein